MNFLRTIRFDDTDDNVFERSAQGGEWAVSGAFAFAALDPAEVAGKTKQAFANGFLSVESWGRSTFTSVSQISDADLNRIEERLGEHFIINYGAPDMAAAIGAAREEIKFIQDLCEKSMVNTVFSVRREYDGAGQIREEYRKIHDETDDTTHARIWSVVEERE